MTEREATSDTSISLLLFYFFFSACAQAVFVIEYVFSCVWVDGCGERKEKKVLFERCHGHRAMDSREFYLYQSGEKSSSTVGNELYCS